MRFISDRVSEEWIEGKVDPALRGLVEDAQDFATSVYQWEFLLTCLLRTPQENDSLYVSRGFEVGSHLNGVHVVGRGADVRTRDIDPEAVTGLIGYLNERYIYDHERPQLKVALFENGVTAGSGAHLHVQVHPNTQNRHFEETS